MTYFEELKARCEEHHEEHKAERDEKRAERDECHAFDVAEREDRHELKEETKANSHEAERLERDEDRKDKAMGKAAEAEERADEDREELHDRFGVDEIPADNKSE